MKRIARTLAAWLRRALAAVRRLWRKPLPSVPTDGRFEAGVLLAGDILLPVPSSAVTTWGGGVLGVGWATLASSLGMTLGAAVGFALARTLGRRFVTGRSAGGDLDPDAAGEDACTAIRRVGAHGEAVAELRAREGHHGAVPRGRGAARPGRRTFPDRGPDVPRVPHPGGRRDRPPSPALVQSPPPAAPRGSKSGTERQARNSNPTVANAAPPPQAATRQNPADPARSEARQACRPKPARHPAPNFAA